MLRSDRLARLVEAMAQADVSAYIAASAPSLRWLHGLAETGGSRFLGLAVHRSGAVRFIGPALSGDQARRAGVSDLDLWQDGIGVGPALRRLTDEWGLEGGSIALDDDAPSVMAFDLLESCPGVGLVRGLGLRSRVMGIKDAKEIDLMVQAGRIADEAYLAVLARLDGEFRAGRALTERAVGEMLWEEMEARGGTPTFHIVGTGPGSAEPHHHSGEDEIGPGVLLLDFGCTVGGYHSDITRVVHVGPVTDPEVDSVYKVVHQAQQAAANLAGPGVRFQDVDRAARSVIEAAGYGTFFTHRTGHGIGSTGHEPPHVVSDNIEAMAPGNCFSIEPGIYLPGRFGVRLENLHRVTPDGAASFNASIEPAIRILGV
ncbi:MAG: Xaa-Pro peptidase family protein [Fimbriimonadaceae bacterium]|nr:Xaa-Pro peptidase family protein [Fimbriimonadaceae bacterium]